MPNNKDNTKNIEKTKKELIDLNDTFNDTLSSLATSITGVSNTHAVELHRLNREVDSIINAELNNTKSITSDDMSTFMVKLFNDFDNKNKINEKSLSDVFENEGGGLFQFFQQRYQNKNLLFEDLEMITAQLYEMEEAIMTTRDAIITSDDISTIVSRTLSFKNRVGDDNVDNYIKTVEELENRFKLLTKIKNMIVPNTLKYGSYYVYCCPYSKLFQEQYDKKVKDPMNIKSVSESIDTEFINELTKDLTSIDAKVGFDGASKTKVPEKLLEVTKAYTSNIEVYNDTCSIPLVEGLDVTELIDNDEFIKARDKVIKKHGIKTKQTTTDGTVDIKDKKGNFSDVTGCYIKYIDPKKIIPVKILDTTLGYYYIHETDFKVNKSPFSTTINVTNITSGQNYQNTEDVETMFLGRITDKIIKSFDKKFLENNIKFKELIFNALLYNNLYSKQIKFQFIPADYVVEYTVNEDADGNGQSVLNKALFYAKLYLALLIFKMVSIVSKSNDQRVYYVKNSGMDTNITNKIQEVARSVKGRQINFMDLLNYNSIISKIGAFKEIFIPVGRSGERGIEFDILQGQDIPVNTDLMEMLRTNMINATGVPSVIMNYINEVDFAKTLTMANSKFIGRVISYQLDLNGPTTELYKMIIKYSNTSIPEEIIEQFEFIFNPPKTLNTMNLSDILNNTDQLVSYMIKIMTGENADQTQDSNKIKDKVYKILAKNYLPMLDWAAAEEAIKDAKIEIAKENIETKVNSNSNETESGY